MSKLQSKGKSNGNQGRKGNFKRGNGKYNRRRDTKDVEPEGKVASNEDNINDSSFYYTDTMLRDQLNNYSLTGFLGNNAKVGDRKVGDVWNKVLYGIPSMMRLYINPSVQTDISAVRNGQSYRTSGIYKVGLKNYYLLSANNAKVTNYQPSDVTLLILTLGSVAAYVSFIQRAFGSMYKYNQRNKDLPEQLVTGMHIDYADFKNNLANYRTRFNVILNTINKIPIPGNISYISKWGSMFSNFYIDEYNNPLAQWYMMVPQSLWKLNELKSDKGPGLDTVNVCTGGLHNMSYFLNSLEEMIEAILASSTFNFIFADILRLVEKGGFPTLAFQLIPDDYDAPVLFSDEFNMWVDNAEVMGTPKTNPADSRYTAYNDVYTDVTNNQIHYNPAFTRPEVAPAGFINFKVSNPDIEMRVAAIRLKNYVRFYTDQEDTTETGASIPDAYLCGIGVYGTTPYNNLREWTDMYQPCGFNRENLGEVALYVVGSLTQFNYAPKYIVCTSTDVDTKCCTVFGTLDYWTEIDYVTFENIWDAEWLGLIEMRSK